MTPEDTGGNWWVCPWSDYNDCIPEVTRTTTHLSVESTKQDNNTAPSNATQRKIKNHLSMCAFSHDEHDLCCHRAQKDDTETKTGNNAPWRLPLTPGSRLDRDDYFLGQVIKNSLGHVFSGLSSTHLHHFRWLNDHEIIQWYLSWSLLSPDFVCFKFLCMEILFPFCSLDSWLDCQVVT